MPVEVKRARSRVYERLDWLHAWHCLTGPAYGLIHPGLAQRMTAGAGILHSERNDSWVLDGPRHERDVEMVQMWVVPDAAGVTPSYEQLDISAELDAGGLVLVASGVPGHEDDAAIRIRNRYATLWAARLQPGASVHLPAAPWVHLYVPRGSVDVEGVGLLSTGDAARCTDEPGRRVTAREASEVLVWEMLTSL